MKILQVLKVVALVPPMFVLCMFIGVVCAFDKKYFEDCEIWGKDCVL